MNSGHVEQALRWHINPFQQTLIPECTIICDMGLKTGHSGFVYNNYIDYRADFLTISVAGYVTEIEVKVSRSDWKADIEKQKWGNLPPYITKFVYAVPEKLGIPDFVPDFAGIWHIYESGDMLRVRVVRAPKRIGKEKVSAKIKEKWMSVFYSRYWNQRIHASRNLPKILKVAA